MSSATQPLIQRYYDNDPAYEWQRMDRHRTEFAVTLRALAEHLPPPPARVLDCGGGPGRYALELARQGYMVTLFDLSPACLAFARDRAAEAGVTLAGYEQGSATDLARFPAAAFDAVLLLGPLYHLLAEDERGAAIAEARRVLAPGGTLAAACITRYAALRDAARRDPDMLVEQADVARRILEQGLLLPRTWLPSTRADAAAAEGGSQFIAHFVQPAGVARPFWGAGLEVLAVLGVEGLVSMIEERVNQLRGPAWEAWAGLNYRAAADPALHGAVEHLLVVARQPRWRPVLAALAGQLNAAGIPYTVAGGASVALHGVPVPVKDIDIEVSAAGAYACDRLWAAHAVQRVAFTSSPLYRSHFGRFAFPAAGEVAGQEPVTVEIMGDLERAEDGAWAPTWCLNAGTRDLDGVPVRAAWLEEETLAYLRRGRLERAAQCLPYCSPERMTALLSGQVATQILPSARRVSQ